MNSEMNAVVISRLAEGQWEAQHIPSGRRLLSYSMETARAEMKKLLGIDEDGTFSEPLTSEKFTGLEREIALFLEGPISEMLALHSGFARLESMDGATAYVRLGGGCKGCPSSTLTLVGGVRSQLQERFGSAVVTEVLPSL